MNSSALTLTAIPVLYLTKYLLFSNHPCQCAFSETIASKFTLYLLWLPVRPCWVVNLLKHKNI